jgi:glycosyltransferase involved in cell wall biosynthesis
VLRVLTSNRAVSLQVVSADVCKVANERGVRAVWHDRPMLVSEMRRAGDDALIVMAADPLNAAPWFLLARDCRHGGVRATFYATVEGRLNRRCVREYMREVDFVANSRYVRDRLAEAGLAVKGVVPHGVDVEACEAARRSRELGASYFMKHGLDPSRDLVFLTVASSHPRKGLAWLDRVVGLVGEKDPGVKFMVVTEERGRAYFKPHPNLVVTDDFGRLPRQMLLSIMASARALVVPSLSEGFCLPVLEAMALGTPAVHAALPPLLEFSTGFVVPVKEVLYFDREVVGPSGIEYEQHLYDVGEFAEVLLYAADMLRNKREAVEAVAAKGLEAAGRLDVRSTYPALLRLMGYEL